VDASRKKTIWRFVQWIALAAIVWFAWRTVAKDWDGVTAAFASVHIGVLPALASCAIVLASYAVLIETWRRVVMAWGSSLSFGTASRIWFISNLGKYLPGKIWTITAMGAMAQQAGVSPVAAVGSSLLIAVINILAGVAVVLLTASDALPLPQGVVIALGVVAVAIALMPSFLPAAARWIAARFGREVSWPPLPYHTTLIAYAGCAAAWVMYGLAFQLLVSATFGATAGVTPRYIAVFTTSYIAGYVFLLAPGGLGVREFSLGELLTKYGMATVATATVIAVVSRVWLTVLELVPGLILLVFSPQVSKQIPNAKSRTL
jgi:hypothetical protein